METAVVITVLTLTAAFGVGVLGLTAWGLHELGHVVMWLAAGSPIREIVIGAGDVTAIRTVTVLGRRVQLTLRKWLWDAAGIAVPRDIRASASPLVRVAVHLCGPAVNVLVALGAWHLANISEGLLRLIGTAAWITHGYYAAVNLLPLPLLDGGWLTTLAIARLTGRDYDWEERWHIEHAVWTRYAQWIVAILVLAFGMAWVLRNW